MKNSEKFWLAIHVIAMLLFTYYFYKDIHDPAFPFQDYRFLTSAVRGAFSIVLCMTLTIHLVEKVAPIFNRWLNGL